MTPEQIQAVRLAYRQSRIRELYHDRLGYGEVARARLPRGAAACFRIHHVGNGAQYHVRGWIGDAADDYCTVDGPFVYEAGPWGRKWP